MQHRGAHPAKDILRERRIWQREAAEAVGLHPVYVGYMLTGRRPASARFRRDLATFLDLPESALFTDEPAKTAS